MDSGTVDCERKEGKLTIRLQGSFDYGVVVKLKRLLETQSKASEYVIDLQEATYINSSAFGAMVYIKEKFSASNDEISIINASPSIMKLLKSVHFDQLFRVV
ncbi:MAG: STAS domain-containing protein [Magnetococcales bacterium]|nr:STAS domain-containing protein [Magnetococcales bacterium]